MPGSKRQKHLPFKAYTRQQQEGQTYTEPRLMGDPMQSRGAKERVDWDSDLGSDHAGGLSTPGGNGKYGRRGNR